MIATIMAGLLAGIIVGFIIGAARESHEGKLVREREHGLLETLADTQLERAKQAQDETDQLRHQNRVLVSRLASLTQAGATVDPNAALAAQEKFEPEVPLPPALQGLINEILDPETRQEVEADARAMFNQGVPEEQIETMLLGGAG